MSSWFSSIAEKATALSESALKATEEAVEGLQKNGDMLQKLTLSTPELTAERQKMDQEERRKEAVRDKLAGLLPWETRDTERDILVEECKEVILKLSSEEQTFYGPWQVPDKNVVLETGELKEPSAHDLSGRLCGIGGPEDTSMREEEEEDEVQIKETPVHPKTPKPSPESLEQLAKLEPLPTLLAEFDLDSHVGLIQRLLAADPKLVHAQSQWSGGGAREAVFWKNYFFHCAYSRYEAGLSVDEVWSDEAIERNAQELEEEKKKRAQEAKKPWEAVTRALGKGNKADPQAKETVDNQATRPLEHEISFEGDKDATVNPEVTPSKPAETLFSTDHEDVAAETHEEASAPVAAMENTTDDGDDNELEYDIVDDDQVGNDLITSESGSNKESDPELDELEAEIARELED